MALQRIATISFAAVVILPSLLLAKEIKSGTGFFVSKNGHILTNNHVIDKCAAVTTVVNGIQHNAAVIGVDSANDLAVLHVTMQPEAVSYFRNGRSIRAGDDVVVIGYPLRHELSTEAIVTTGTVSAMAGLRNNSTYMQLSAPVQPGNSGGPVLDEYGFVVGVVAAVMDAVRMAREDHVIPQNVNFAVHAGIVRAFLDAHAIPYELKAPGKRSGRSEIADTARRYTFPLICHDTPPRTAETEDAHEELIRVAIAVLDRDYPDWFKIVLSQEYKHWLSNQPKEFQRKLSNTLDPLLIEQAIAAFLKTTNAPAQPTVQSPPTLDEWMRAARIDNPGVPDRELRKYWARKYGKIDPKTLPAWNAFLPVMKARVPNASEEDLRQYWEENYGDFGAAENDVTKSRQPTRADVLREVMKDIELPPNAPQYDDLKRKNQADTMKSVQQQSDLDAMLKKLNVPDMAAPQVPVPQAPPKPNVTPTKRATLSEEMTSDLDRELQELKKLQLPPAVKSTEPIHEVKPMFRDSKQ